MNCMRMKTLKRLVYFEICAFIIVFILVDILNSDESSKQAGLFKTKIYSTPNAQTRCKPKVFFLKTHKTAGSTVFNIFARYGFRRNLKLAIPILGFKHMWPNFFRGKYLEKFSQTPGLHLVHSRFNPRYASSVFPKQETFYVTILRHPVAQWVSIFTYFKKGKPTNIKVATESMEHYMEFFENYTSIIQGAYGKNPNFFDLGFDEKQLSNKHYIRKLIRRIDQQFDLVMITELWEESLLLVQKKMCLSIDEIVVFDANVRVKSIPEISESLKDKILQFNDADHQLYQYFYQKLKEEAKEFHPSDFESLRQRKKFWTDICIGGREHKISYSNRKYLGYMLKNDIDHKYRDECERMVASEIEFVDMYTEKMNEDAANY